MGETFAWREGSLYLWTGTATASALLAYATDMDITLQYGIENYQTLDTAYHNRWSGQRVDVRIGTLYAPDNITLQKFFDAKTGVHIHARQAHALGSGGVYLYSGAIDTLGLAGREGDLFTQTFSYHANRWSAY